MTLSPSTDHPADTRRRALAAGIHGDAVTSTPLEDLELVIAAAPQLRLVFNADEEPNDDHPRLGIALTEEQKRANRHAEMRPDELASLATFARGSLIEHAFASADHFTPYDEFTGGGDAA